MNDITLYTIGSGGKSACRFFTTSRKQESGLSSTSAEKHLPSRRVHQKTGSPFFLEEICGAGYLHIPLLAPTEEILHRYKKEKGSWEDYVSAFNNLLEQRRAETLLSREQLDHACLLCSEPFPDRCHRRLVAEFLGLKMPPVRICHL